MTKRYDIICRSMAQAHFFVEAENEQEAEKKFDEWLAENGPQDLDWETDWIDDVEVMEEIWV